jgi:hypothetical protein
VRFSAFRTEFSRHEVAGKFAGDGSAARGVASDGRASLVRLDDAERAAVEQKLEPFVLAAFDLMLVGEAV